MLFDYPKNAAFGRILPKSKIFEHAAPSTKIKRLFAQQVKQIVWDYKLAPETINIPKSPTASEIQILKIELKGEDIDLKVLETIDRSIPHPLIFEIHSEGKIKVAAAYKRPSEFGVSNWVVSNYFETNWFQEGTPRRPLPVVFNLEELYSQLLNPLMKFQQLPNEKLSEKVERMEQILLAQKMLERSKIALKKEKQFNRKVSINADLRKLIQVIENLTCSQGATIPRGQK